jgi:hypothetical protein
MRMWEALFYGSSDDLVEVETSNGIGEIMALGLLDGKDGVRFRVGGLLRIDVRFGYTGVWSVAVSPWGDKREFDVADLTIEVGFGNGIDHPEYTTLLRVKYRRPLSILPQCDEEHILDKVFDAVENGDLPLFDADNR